MVDISHVDIKGTFEKYLNLGKRRAKTHGGEYWTPCPFCRAGDDRFHVWPDRDDSSTVYWCRQCNESGDIIDFVQYVESINFREACDLLNVKLEKRQLLAVVKSAPAIRALSENARPPAPAWQSRARQVLSEAQDCLWSDSGQVVRRYLASRGLKEETIRAAGLGYIAGRDTYDAPELWSLAGDDVFLPSGIVFPYFYRGQLWKLRVRRLSDNVEPRYIQISGSSNGLYHADAVVSGVPVALFEGEIDALSAGQVAAGQIVACALGSLAHAQIPLWTARLSLASEVLLCFDNDAEDKAKAARKYWLSRLEHARVYLFPAGYKDANDMLTDGADLAAWLGIEVCAVCRGELYSYGPDGTPYCEIHTPGAADLGTWPATALETAARLSAAFPAWHVQLEPAGHRPDISAYAAMAGARQVRRVAAACLHEVVKVSRDNTVVSGPCPLKPVDGGLWCAEHAPAQELLDIGAALGYPGKQLQGAAAIGRGRGSWEAYASRCLCLVSPQKETGLARSLRILRPHLRERTQSAIMSGTLTA